MSDYEISAQDTSIDDSAEEARPRNFWKVLLPILVLILGASTTAAVMSSRKAPERVERPVLGPLVETQTVEVKSVALNVEGQGEVAPKTRVTLTPQVTGRVIRVHPSMVVGGSFRAGTTLVEIEPRDYELAVERARAAVAAAQTVLERERLEAEVARQEWRETRGEKEAPSFLVREPQIREAEARLAAAEADLAVAELNLQRTRVDVPFDGVVIEESVDIGQLAAAGAPLATIYGSDQAEIRVPLDDAELAFFDLPTAGADGPPAVVSADFAGARHAWEGRVERLEGQVDPRSRMVRVIVEVDRPYARIDDRPPLLPGTFVDVEIRGREIDDLAVVPRYVLRGASQAWIVDDGKLRIRDLDVMRTDRRFAYIRSGLEAGDQVIVSSLDAVTDGMTVRTSEEANDE